MIDSDAVSKEDMDAAMEKMRTEIRDHICCKRDECEDKIYDDNCSCFDLALELYSIARSV